jgi:hypothetical protein
MLVETPCDGSHSEKYATQALDEEAQLKRKGIPVRLHSTMNKSAWPRFEFDAQRPKQKAKPYSRSYHND